MNTNTARAHENKRKQRMRRGRVIDITAYSARGRGRSCTRGGDPKHDLHDLKQIHDPTEHARAKRHADRQSKNADERIENRRSGVHDVGHRRSRKRRWVVELHSRKPPIQPQLHKQRDQPRGNVGHDCERRRPEHIRRLYYHSRPTDSITRSAATVMTTTTSVTKSDSAISDDSTHQPRTA